MGKLMIRAKMSRDRAVVQMARMRAWGARGRGFESRQPDISLSKMPQQSFF